MGFAQDMIKGIKGRFYEAKMERKADLAASKIAKKKSKAAYRKALVDAETKKAISEAKADVKAGGRFKRKVAEFKKKRSSKKGDNKIFGGSPFAEQSSNKSGMDQGEYARNKMSIGNKESKNPFQL